MNSEMETLETNNLQFQTHVRQNFVNYSNDDKYVARHMRGIALRFSVRSKKSLIEVYLPEYMLYTLWH